MDKKLTTPISFRLPVKFKKDGGIYVVSCPLLDVVTQGKTINEAKKHIVEAIYFFLLSCYERKTLDRVLRKKGFKPIAVTHKNIKRVPKAVHISKGDRNKRLVDIPLDFPCNYTHPTLSKAA